MTVSWMRLSLLFVQIIIIIYIIFIIYPLTQDGNQVCRGVL